MTEIVGVRFKKVGKVYYFDPAGLRFRLGDKVVVETSRGLEFGEVATENNEVEADKVVEPLKKVIRAASPEDEARLLQNRSKEQEAFALCEKKIKQHSLDMKLIEVEYTFDGSKILFYFTADGRVDFRDLVKDLASVFRTRIELRQIGVRDEAKMVGGLGVCGRPLCCNTFLSEFAPVSIKMAKEQSLSLNPVKISGTCGRLMCCLKYEQEAYEHLNRSAPKAGTRVRTPDGKGTIKEAVPIRGEVKVVLDGQEGNASKPYKLSDVRILRDDLPEEEQQLPRPKDGPGGGDAPERRAAPPADRQEKKGPRPNLPEGEAKEGEKRPAGNRRRPRRGNRPKPKEAGNDPKNEKR